MDLSVLRSLSYGVYIVATKVEDKNVGCVLNSAMQITRNKIAISVHHDNYTNEGIKKTKKFSLSILGEDCDPKIIGTFGYQTSREIDKFQDVSYEEKEDLPVLKDSCGYVVCKVVDQMETETHTVFLGEILACEKKDQKVPMTYAYYHDKLKGKTPKNAPTYQEEKEVPKKKHLFVCRICGYRFESDLEELPEGFKCPICGMGKEFFEKMKI